MNLQQSTQQRTPTNGYSHRRVEKDMGARIDNKSQPGKFNPSPASSSSASRGSSYESPLQDRLVYISTCLIGLHVDVQVKNGSIFSGIFHATSTDKNFGIVLKMARLIKDASNRGQKAASDTVDKAPLKTQIIRAQELVQIMAKDVPLAKEWPGNEFQQENQDLLLDSYISKSRHVEGERQLERWVPDEDDAHCAELENTFDSPWTGRSWDQFKVNETLFGVKSTFNEELYTTKLKKGPRTRELEEEALRIAREIEGEDTQDLHLAEERGIYCHGNIDIDEETRYSSVFRGVDDSGYADEDTMIDRYNNDTFLDSQLSTARSFADVTIGKIHDGDKIVSSTSLVDGPRSSQLNASREGSHSGSQADGCSSWRCAAIEPTFSIQENDIIEEGENAYANDWLQTQVLDEEPQVTTTTEDLQSSYSVIPSAEQTTYAVSNNQTMVHEKAHSFSNELKGDVGSGKDRKVHGASHCKSSRGKPSSFASFTSKGGGATSAFRGPALSPSSSMSSSTSEKSTLNPKAKEFKFNPNAKSYVPSQTPLKPTHPVATDKFYFPANMPAAPPMPGMHASPGVGPSFPGPHPMMFNPQAAPMQMPQMYFPPNGPQYGQQTPIHPRQVMYNMPSYPNRRPYKRREY